MNLSSHDLFLTQGNFVSSATKMAPLGARGADRFGRIYRYCQAGATSLIAGNIIQSPATVLGQLAVSVNTTTSTGVGSTQIAVTCGSSVAANFYADGFLVFATGAGQGVGPMAISSHPAVSTGATGVITLYYEDALQVAITTTTTVSLIPNKYSGVIQLPAATATGLIVGVATYVITNAQYGWIQTWGPCSVLGADTTALGGWAYGPATACGQASGFTATTLLTGQAIGHFGQANVAGQYVYVDLTISP